MMKVLIACEFSGIVREAFKARGHDESPGADRWKRRSRALHGISRAMAEQWG